MGNFLVGVAAVIQIPSKNRKIEQNRHEAIKKTQA
jgi:hypothetical protein